MNSDDHYMSLAAFNIGRYSFFNELNYGLIASIHQNEARIQKSVDRINRQFGLHMKEPKLAIGIEFEIQSTQSLDDLLAMEVRRDGVFHYARKSFAELLHELNLDLTQENTFRVINGEKYFKYELRATRPVSTAEQLYSYSRLLTSVHVDPVHIRRFSHHVNFSVIDAANPHSYPYYNQQFRDLIGHNVLKFVDEALVLLDTKSSIRGTKDKGDRDATDLMAYLPTSSEHKRCFYQLAYRNNDKVVDDYSDEVIASTARHELRRTFPGSSLHQVNVCDPIVAACAIITAGVAHSFEKGEAAKLEPYHYRGTDYDKHMEKFKNSSLLREYLGEGLVASLGKRIDDYHIDAVFNGLLGEREL